MNYNETDPYYGYVKAYEINVNKIPYDTEVIAENLIVPWAIALREDGVIYVTERSGQIRIIEDGVLLTQPLFVFNSPFVSIGEGGLMGIVLDPDFMDNHYIYVMHTFTEDNQLFNRVVRLKEQNNSATVDKVLIDRIPGNRIHNGGRIKIGPDQKLYITTGDAGNAVLSQEPNSLAGKILRIELDGSIPEDNPFSGSPIYSLGHRNPQGLTWGSNQILYSSEHGSQGYDEINIILPGANYGWPLVQGNQAAIDIVVQRPLIYSGTDTWAPSGIAFIQQGPWSGKILVATLRGERLLALSLHEDGTEVERVEAFFQNEFGRLREVVQAKDGSIYLTTSNQDGRGNPDRTDDKIIRLIPKDILI
jgi:glucose/arabinose dehydrogenase